MRRDPAAFRLATLDGHLEAGEIEFRAEPDGDILRFEIESRARARAGDRLAAMLYNKLRLAKEIQLNMWSHFCVRTAALAGGRPQGGITHPHPLGHLAPAHGKMTGNTVRACTWRLAQRTDQGDEHVADPAGGTGALRLHPTSPGSGQCPRQSEKYQMETTGDDHGE